MQLNLANNWEKKKASLPTEYKYILSEPATWRSQE